MHVRAAAWLQGSCVRTATYKGREEKPAGRRLFQMQNVQRRNSERDPARRKWEAESGRLSGGLTPWLPSEMTGKDAKTRT